MTTLTVRIPEALRRELEKRCRREKRTLSAIVRDSLRRYVAADRFRLLRNQTQPLAEAEGYRTDDDVFNG